MVIKRTNREFEAKRERPQAVRRQQQRVAIARALAGDAGVILADEPTENLDADTAREIIIIFKQLAHEYGKCVIVVTHSQELAREADCVFRFENGTLSMAPPYVS